MLFINGVPVIVGETKSATHSDGIAEALDDIRYYHRQGPELLALLQLHSITHLIQFYYGATWNMSRKGLFNWRDEQAGNYSCRFQNIRFRLRRPRHKLTSLSHPNRKLLDHAHLTGSTAATARYAS